MSNSGLYTGNGDRGYTSTVKNNHIPKYDYLIELIGELDEYSSALGLARAQSSDEELCTDIKRVQKKLISIMGELAGGEISVTADCVKVVESLCDKYMPEDFSGFVIPGDNIVSAQLDIARTIVRRAERTASRLIALHKIRPETYTYLNRLSDMTYAFARYAAEERKTAKKQIGAVSETVTALTLGLAKEISLAVEKRAEEMGKRVVIAILDEGANLMLLHSMPEAYIASRQIAQDKAYTAVSLKMPTHIALAESRGGSLDGLCATDSNRLMLLGGGEPLIINGKVMGGIGVSGGTAEEDTAFAEFGAMYLERRLSL
jgi:ATP:cob(I)alamin adenosyltransferase